MLGKIGTLEVRLARNAEEIVAAQEIRYRVFYEELGARRAAGGCDEGRDFDRFDAICDHLLVLDSSIEGPEVRQIVGTYRLLRQETAMAAGGFYSEDEFELAALVARHPNTNFLELGRSCVLPAYRGKRTIEVLWQGIWAYVNHYDIGVMTGCASFQGTEPADHAEALSFLAHHCRAEGEWAIRAVADRYRAMDLMPPEAIGLRCAMAAMPPLIKGYLRLGARIGEGCVIDHEFGTIDVCIVLPVASLDARYVTHYSPDATRFAA
ncbi:GNAT family N-acetyltransferase [Arvimicrobium flavum]|uniref:GNAT family N-acetyltransferase n=1 Tax=Arvimicrobium flavum TaxID=3393320 RepID=UPI00237C0DD5|nr:GNAT family N-acetyltransferase [Mesorhizobium shangrilense]